MIKLSSAKISLKMCFLYVKHSLFCFVQCETLEGGSCFDNCFNTSLQVKYQHEIAKMSKTFLGFDRWFIELHQVTFHIN